MSDKPKTFEEWMDEDIEFGISCVMKRRAFHSKSQMALTKNGWNARDALAKEEVEATRQEMQAEIDKRDTVIAECVRIEHWHPANKYIKELNQGSKDGHS